VPPIESSLKGSQINALAIPRVFSPTPSGSWFLGWRLWWRRPTAADLPPAILWQAAGLLPLTAICILPGATAAAVPVTDPYFCAVMEGGLPNDAEQPNVQPCRIEISGRSRLRSYGAEWRGFKRNHGIE